MCVPATDICPKGFPRASCQTISLLLWQVEEPENNGKSKLTVLNPYTVKWSISNAMLLHTTLILGARKSLRLATNKNRNYIGFALVWPGSQSAGKWSSSPKVYGSNLIDIKEGFYIMRSPSIFSGDKVQKGTKVLGSFQYSITLDINSLLFFNFCQWIR